MRNECNRCPDHTLAEKLYEIGVSLWHVLPTDSSDFILGWRLSFHYVHRDIYSR